MSSRMNVLFNEGDVLVVESRILGEAWRSMAGHVLGEYSVAYINQPGGEAQNPMNPDVASAVCQTQRTPTNIHLQHLH